MWWHPSDCDPAFMTNSPEQSTSFRAVSYAIAGLCTGFATVHMAWAFGWRGGIPDSAGPIGDRPIFLAYDIGAGLLMYVAAGVCIALAGRELNEQWHRRAVLAILVASAFALMRGVPALMFDAYAATTGTAVHPTSVLADVWFTVVGLGGLVLWRAMTGSQRVLVHR